MLQNLPNLLSKYSHIYLLLFPFILPIIPNLNFQTITLSQFLFRNTAVLSAFHLVNHVSEHVATKLG